MKLPENIEGFIKAQNESDSTAFANYFTKNATVSDEGSSYSGRRKSSSGYRRRQVRWRLRGKF